MKDRHIESIDAYMNGIEQYGRITVKDEIELADKMRNGSDAERKYARDKLITSNLKLVVKIAHDFKNYGVPFPDLVAEGNLGLLTAVDKFDPAHGAKFSCYAAWWIKQAMRKAVAWQSRTIRIPSGSAQKLCRIKKAEARLSVELGRQPTLEELSEASGCSVQVVDNLLKSACETFSIYETLTEDTATTFETSIAENEEDTSTERSARIDSVRQAVEALPALDRMIVGALYHVGDDHQDIRRVAMESGLPVKNLLDRAPGILDRLRELLAGADVHPALGSL